ncbi:MAG: transglutaminase domain-containing protein [Oscillospiraceae bacterium]|nr:transglutaminase domain-containing protein [Oscillospiraceae bacterium]
MRTLCTLQKLFSLLLALGLVLSLAACGSVPADDTPPEDPPAVSQDNGETEAAPTGEIPQEAVADSVVVEDADTAKEAEALTASPPAVPMSVTVSAPGIEVSQNDVAVIDYSNAASGYVMVRYTADTSSRLKVRVESYTTYTYNLTPGQWTAFPLSDGSGSYQVTLYQNVVDSKYAAVLGASFYAALHNEFEPFLHSNQYVNYDAAPDTVSMAAYLTDGCSDTLEKVEAVYDYVVANISYDTALAASVKSGYLPVLDNVLATKQGICFDYAAVMTGMLRSQGVPCKLVVGYAGSAYHAWISVWVDGSGWVDGVIWFDGTAWQRMDPTFASSGNSSADILAYIGNGANYSAKYFY